MRPHRSEYWLFPKIENEDEFIHRIEKLCSIYQRSMQPDATIMVTSSDEKTGIQAILHQKTSPMKVGRDKRVETEYVRNGTTCLIAARNVATGAISSYSLGRTRKEEDYLAHVKDIVEGGPGKEHIIICDQLNTHKSESLVKWVASKINDSRPLGIKGKEGILRSQKSRMEFLEDEGHRIRFFYTPKHCSWMNQIENWFAILENKVIRHGQFASVDQLESKIDKFISYYNKVLVKPVNWTFNAESYRQKLMN